MITCSMANWICFHPARDETIWQLYKYGIEANANINCFALQFPTDLHSWISSFRDEAPYPTGIAFSFAL